MVDVTLNRSDIKGNLCQILSSYAFWLLIYGGGKLIYETDLVIIKKNILDGYRKIYFVENTTMYCFNSQIIVIIHYVHL